jgi:hypothetical protein
MSIRTAAVAGTWYPGTRGALEREVDTYLEGVPEDPGMDVRAIVAPHAGIMFSGPVAAHAYKAAAAAGPYDVAVLVGPSHFVAFEGVAVSPDAAFDSPLGLAAVDERGIAALSSSPIVSKHREPHRREHSLEMQLPFLRRVLPDVPIVPLVMGFQRRETIVELGRALTAAFQGRRPLLIGSTDLSHFFDAGRAASLDGIVQTHVEGFDPEGLLARFEEFPEQERGRWVACGGGPAIAVMLAARGLGATEARVLKYGHSGEISGDNASVVGYMAAALGSAAR